MTCEDPTGMPQLLLIYIMLNHKKTAKLGTLLRCFAYLTHRRKIRYISGEITGAPGVETDDSKVYALH